MPRIDFRVLRNDLSLVGALSPILVSPFVIRASNLDSGVAVGTAACIPASNYGAAGFLPTTPRILVRDFLQTAALQRMKGLGARYF